MKKQKRISLKIKRYKTFMIVAILMFIFPLIVGLVYFLPLPQIIAVDSGELLAYYGVTFGIFGSFTTYFLDRKKEKTMRNRELTPVFAVQVTKSDDVEHLFNISIINRSSNPQSYLYLYDEYLCDVAGKQHHIPVVYLQTVKVQDEAEAQFNITMDSDILDEDGYPSYVQLLCEDIDGNNWNCCYFRVKNGATHFYYPRNIEII